MKNNNGITDFEKRIMLGHLQDIEKITELGGDISASVDKLRFFINRIETIKEDEL